MQKCVCLGHIIISVVQENTEFMYLYLFSNEGERNAICEDERWKEFVMVFVQ